MAAKENPNFDAIEVDVSEIDTSANGNSDMTETNKAQDEATLANYQKMAAFTTLKKADARRSIGGHKSHLTQTQNAADRAVTTPAVCKARQPLKIWNVAWRNTTQRPNTMELAYEHLLIVDPVAAESWEREEAQPGRPNQAAGPAEKQPRNRSPATAARQMFQVRQGRPLHQGLQAAEDDRMQRLQETRHSIGGMHDQVAQARNIKAERTESQGRARGI